MFGLKLDKAVIPPPPLDVVSKTQLEVGERLSYIYYIYLAL